MKIAERFAGCILAGAIGDAYGSVYENQKDEFDSETTLYLFGKPKKTVPNWKITDDTQLTLATCETISENENLNAELFAEKFLKYYKSRKITGIGASTLKAMRELEVGGHWSLVGRKGEYSAGNGAAMRIAPLGFVKNISKPLIKDICNITHQNDEAYIGALSVVIAIQLIINETWTGKENLIELIINEIPDTKVRDRLIEINKLDGNLTEIGKLGTSGYVVNSVPLAIAFASKIKEIGMNGMFEKIIELGGDTDTNCSIAGQIAGTLVGEKGIPTELKEKLMEIKDFEWINSSIKEYGINKNWV